MSDLVPYIGLQIITCVSFKVPFFLPLGSFKAWTKVFSCTFLPCSTHTIYTSLITSWSAPNLNPSYFLEHPSSSSNAQDLEWAMWWSKLSSKLRELTLALTVYGLDPWSLHVISSIKCWLIENHKLTLKTFAFLW